MEGMQPQLEPPAGREKACFWFAEKMMINHDDDGIWLPAGLEVAPGIARTCFVFKKKSMD